MSKKNSNKKKNKKSKFFNTAFLAVLVLAIVVGFAFTISGHTDVLEYENRPAAKLGGFTFAGYFSGDFQNHVEESFVDQAIASNGIKHGFNLAKSHLISNALKPLGKYENDSKDTDDHEIIVDDTNDIGGSEISPGISDDTTIEPVENVEPVEQVEPVEPVKPVEPDTVITKGSVEIETTQPSIEPNTKAAVEPVVPENATADGGKYYSVGGGLYKYGEYVVQGVVNLKANQGRFDTYVNRYNDLIAEYPDINFYAYYIERDSDQNYATGRRSGVAEYLKSAFNLPSSNFGVQEVLDFDTYKEYNYKSDHHWAYKGSYNGYKDMLSMLKPNEMPLEILGEYKIGTYKGSFTKTDATANVKDDFYAYELPFPEMQVKFNNKAVKDYGSQSTYISKAKDGNESQKPTYGSFFGNDVGFIDIYNPSGTGSLLIFGNSYDNAIVKPLASHYEHTYCIDLRYYKSSMGSAFSFSKFTSEHQVDDVIAVGNAYYFLQGAFTIPK